MGRKLTPDDIARRAEVVRLRGEHLDFRTIGQRLSISAQRAWTLYYDELRREPVADLVAHRAEAQALVDAALADLLPLARDTQVSPRTRAETWGVIRQWAEHAARLSGIYAPTRTTVAVVTEDAIDAEIARLEREIVERGGTIIEQAP